MSALLVGIFTLGGVTLTHIFQAKRSQSERADQRADQKRERADQKRERIRQAYAEWVGALLRLTDHLCRFLTWEDLKKVSGPVGVKVLDEDQQENIAFARVRLTDGDKKRTEDAQEVRAPLKDSLQEDSPEKPLNEMKFTEIDNRQKLALRRFVDRVCDELDGEPD